MNTYVFADLPVGKHAVVQVVVQPEHITDFAEFSGDRSAIHMDDGYARSRGFEKRLVHGLIVGAHISAFIGMTLPGKHGLLQSMDCRFRKPLYAPNVLTIQGKVVRRSEAVRVVTLEIVVTDQDGDEIVYCEANSVLKL